MMKKARIQWAVDYYTKEYAEAVRRGNECRGEYCRGAVIAYRLVLGEDFEALHDDLKALRNIIKAEEEASPCV